MRGRHTNDDEPRFGLHRSVRGFHLDGDVSGVRAQAVSKHQTAVVGLPNHLHAPAVLQLHAVLEPSHLQGLLRSVGHLEAAVLTHPDDHRLGELVEVVGVELGYVWEAEKQTVYRDTLLVVTRSVL